MRYLLYGVILVLEMTLCLLGQNTNISRIENVKNEDFNIQGSYKLISRKTHIISPSKLKSEETISAPDWKGIYIFNKGYFSQTLMKTERSYSEFPSYYKDLSYESFAGKYIVDGNRLKLEKTLSLNQYMVEEPIEIELKTDQDKLILLERIAPRIESQVTGTITTVLQKIHDTDQ